MTTRLGAALGVGAAAVALLGCVVAAPPTGGRHGSAARPTSPAPSLPTTTTSAPTTTTTSPAPSTTVPPAPALLGPGDQGPAVLQLQERLAALGYWLGTPSGTFDDVTEQAVYALQKAAGLSRDGIVGPATTAALAEGVVPRPRSTSGYVIEVDLELQLLMVVSDGRLVAVLNTSTGGGYTYVEDGVTAVAVTPTGHFQIQRQVDGLVTDPLGQLWRPKFFDQGYAIHGDSDVPPYPVSHGCVRVSNEAIDWIWSSNVAPIGTAVWVY